MSNMDHGYRWIRYQIGEAASIVLKDRNKHSWYVAPQEDPPGHTGVVVGDISYDVPHNLVIFGSIDAIASKLRDAIMENAPTQQQQEREWRSDELATELRAYFHRGDLECSQNELHAFLDSVMTRCQAEERRRDIVLVLLALYGNTRAENALFSQSNEVNE